MNAKKDSTKITVRLAIASVFAALVCIATIIFVISVPATTGYFNIGETVIYVAALLFGPYVGAFAGGVGAAIADIIVAPVFAPATLVVKGCEGAIVGFLNKKMFPSAPKSNWRIYTILLGVVIGVLLAVTGSVTISGYVELYWGIPPQENPTLTGYIPPETWYLLGGIAALLIILIGFKMEPELGRSIFSVIVGGLEMVAGYFLYEQLALNKAAIVEIPINIGQMLIGLIIAIPIVKIVLRSLPQLKS
ncbi:ECF transporter S component [Candidatus Bathyarchaeota archaeon]|nr:ECF transporter S component [Candidatus Bathyarchaeota archaeon]